MMLFLVCHDVDVQADDTVPDTRGNIAVVDACRYWSRAISGGKAYRILREIHLGQELWVWMA